MSKTRASCLIRGSKHLKTIKAIRRGRHAFICFSVFGTPDETLALVFDISLNIPSSLSKVLKRQELTLSLNMTYPVPGSRWVGTREGEKKWSKDWGSGASLCSAFSRPFNNFARPDPPKARNRLHMTTRVT